LQNLLYFRFANTFSRSPFGIENYVKGRGRSPMAGEASAFKGAGAFYEEVGAIRDLSFRITSCRSSPCWRWMRRLGHEVAGDCKPRSCACSAR